MKWSFMIYYFLKKPGKFSDGSKRILRQSLGRDIESRVTGCTSVGCLYARNFMKENRQSLLVSFGKRYCYLRREWMVPDGLLEKDILKKLYAQLNIPVMDLPYGVTLEYRNGMGIVLNYTDKPYKFVLPSGAKVLIGEPVIPTAGVLVFSITD